MFATSSSDHQQLLCQFQIMNVKRSKVHTVITKNQFTLIYLQDKISV
jgi:hypothetical protein